MPDVQSSLTPDALDPDAPIPVAVLRDAIFGWLGQEVTVGGHLWLFMGDERKLEPTTYLGATPDAGPEGKRIECRMASLPHEAIQRTAPLVVRGTLDALDTFRGVVRLQGCEVVSVGEPFDADTPAVPGQSAPIAAQALHDATHGWVGREATVEGYFKGSITSRVSSGTITRIELDAGPSVGFGERVVSCKMEGEADVVIPQSALDDRAGVIMRGTISGDGFPYGKLDLDACTFVNR